jgi:hypothetical protein
MPEKKTATKAIVGSSSAPNAAEQSHLSKIKEQPLQTVQERIVNGKTARTRCPREAHAAWEVPQDRPDPIEVLETQAKSRIPQFIPIRYGRMLASPFAFYRGAAAIMASDLAHTPNSGLEVQLCGDATCEISVASPRLSGISINLLKADS